MNGTYKQPSNEEIKALRQQGAERQTSPWLPEEKAELEEMFYECVDITTMAIHFKRSEPAIMMQIDKMGLYQKMPRRRIKKSGCKCPECEHYADGNCALGLRCDSAP